MILPDICGRLEGESMVAKDLEGISNLWCVEEPPLSDASWPALSHNSSPTMTATPITSPGTKLTMWDWREPILRMLRSEGLEISLRITTTPPSSLSDLPPSPISSVSFSSSVDNLLIVITVGHQFTYSFTFGISPPSLISPTQTSTPTCALHRRTWYTFTSIAFEGLGVDFAAS